MSRARFGHKIKGIWMILPCMVVLNISLGYSQNNHNGMVVHEAVMNSAWRAINTLNNQYSGLGDAKFAPELRALHNKTVTLSGYMIPVRSAPRHERFMLSVLPILQCMFCGQGDIPPMIEILMKDRAIPYSDFPVEIRGRLVLDIRADGGAEVRILDSELM